MCKLHKFDYSLKQSSWQRNSKLSSSLISLDYQKSQSNQSFCVKFDHKKFIALLVYVDDIVMDVSTFYEIQVVKETNNLKLRILVNWCIL